jgi:hypothetical protein
VVADQLGGRRGRGDRIGVRAPGAGAAMLSHRAPDVVERHHPCGAAGASDARLRSGVGHASWRWRSCGCSARSPTRRGPAAPVPCRARCGARPTRGSRSVRPASSSTPGRPKPDANVEAAREQTVTSSHRTRCARPCERRDGSSTYTSSFGHALLQESPSLAPWGARNHGYDLLVSVRDSGAALDPPPASALGAIEL